MTTEITQEIVIGSFVGLKRFHEEPETQDQADRFIRAHGRGPFKVRGQIDDLHVSLEDMNGNPIHFGNTDYLSIHRGYVELWHF